jgi:hypothetical protein
MSSINVKIPWVGSVRMLSLGGHVRIIGWDGASAGFLWRAESRPWLLVWLGHFTVSFSCSFICSSNDLTPGFDEDTSRRVCPPSKLHE